MPDATETVDLEAIRKRAEAFIADPVSRADGVLLAHELKSLLDLIARERAANAELRAAATCAAAIIGDTTSDEALEILKAHGLPQEAGEDETWNWIAARLAAALAANP